MLKRTKGRILLTMLVITGLAGTVNNSTLSNQERKFAIAQLKETRTELLLSVKGLSETQINFKPSAHNWSIKECLYHISLTEKDVWDKLEAAMKEPARPERRSELQISDEQVLKATADLSCSHTWTESSQYNKNQFQTTSDALSNFRSARAEHLKYVKTTTGDLRNHFIQLPIGWVDCYQAIIFMAAQCENHIQLINELLVNPSFPRK